MCSVDVIMCLTSVKRPQDNRLLRHIKVRNIASLALLSKRNEYAATEGISLIFEKLKYHGQGPPRFFFFNTISMVTKNSHVIFLFLFHQASNTQEINSKPLHIVSMIVFFWSSKVKPEYLGGVC